MPERSRPRLIVALLLGAALAPPGCAPDRRRITPTTTGTNLRQLPRGRMTPQPFPGSSLARAGTVDPAAVAASGPAPTRP